MSSKSPSKTRFSGTIVLNKFLFFALIICAVAFGAGILALVQHLGGTVAIVNGEKISRDDLYEAMYNSSGSSTLEDLIVRVLVDQEAKKAGVSVSDSELQDQIQKIINEQYGSESVFESTLQYYGMTRQAFEDQWRTYLLAEKILKPSLSASDEEIQAYFDAHHDELNQKESVTLREIVTATKEEAQAVLDQLKAGADFATLASQKSIDSSKSNGGNVGVVYRGDYPSQVESVIFGLKVGDFSDPVQVDNGYAIFNVTARTDAKVVTLDEVKDKVKDLVLNEKVQNSLSDWISEIRSQANIQYK